MALLAEGRSVAETMRLLDLSEDTYSYYRRSDPDFKIEVEKIRRKLASGDGKAPRPEVPDFPEFCEKYLGQRLFWHQLQWFDLLEGRPPRDMHPAMTYEPGVPQRLIVNTPTGHAKSTTLTVNYVVWSIVKNPDIKIKIVSKTARMAEDFLLQVKQRLTDSMYADLIRDFAPPGGYNANAAQWKQSRIYVSGDIRSAEQKDPTVEALGVKGQIYGARADLIILDDVVDNLNVGEYESQIKWIQGMLLNRLGRNSRLMVIGTRIAAKDLYTELMNPQYYNGRKPTWTYFAQKAVLEFAEDPKDWVVLWPRTDAPEDPSMVADDEGLFPKWDGELLAERRDESGAEFSRMYQQETIAEDTTFKPDDLLACVQDMRYPGKLANDPRIGREGGMDGLTVIASMDPAAKGFTAAIVYALDRATGQRWVLDVFNKAKTPPQEIKGLIRQWTLDYGVDEWRVEDNAFQAFLTQDPELTRWVASQGSKLSGHTTGKNKADPDLGVAGMAALFQARLISLPTTRSERIQAFVDQLVAWEPQPPRGVKTDMVMALWFAELRARDLVVKQTLRTPFRDSPFLSKSDRAARTIRYRDGSVQQWGARAPHRKVTDD